MTAENVSNSPAVREERRVPRYNFVAMADLNDAATAMKLSGRVTEISRKGCYVDILNGLPVGTMLHVQISCDQGTFTSKAKIIYVQERFGMGIAFLDPLADQLRTLDRWLAALPASDAH